MNARVTAAAVRRPIGLMNRIGTVPITVAATLLCAHAVAVEDVFELTLRDSIVWICQIFHILTPSHVGLGRCVLLIAMQPSLHRGA